MPDRTLYIKIPARTPHIRAPPIYIYIYIYGYHYVVDRIGKDIYTSGTSYIEIERAHTYMRTDARTHAHPLACPNRSNTTLPHSMSHVRAHARALTHALHLSGAQSIYPPTHRPPPTLMPVRAHTIAHA